MTLDEYMTRFAVSDDALAAKLGVTAKSVYRWRTLRRSPKPEVADQLVHITGGLVTHADIYGRGRRACLEDKDAAGPHEAAE
jgi:hypothetical protein